jgi:hypothetical protein
MVSMAGGVLGETTYNQIIAFGMGISHARGCLGLD